VSVANRATTRHPPLCIESARIACFRASGLPPASFRYSRTIFEAPIISPVSFLIGETVSEMVRSSRPGAGERFRMLDRFAAFDVFENSVSSRLNAAE
jgi:hypothetical protein